MNKKGQVILAQPAYHTVAGFLPWRSFEKVICKAPDQWENNIIFGGKCLFDERAHIGIASVEKLILHEVSPERQGTRPSLRLAAL